VTPRPTDRDVTAEEDIEASLALITLLLRSIAPYRNGYLAQVEHRLDRALTTIKNTFNEEHHA